MYRCLVTPEQLLTEAYELDRGPARHLSQVLRVTTGETIELFDGEGQTRLAIITSAGRKRVTVQACADPVKHPPPRCKLTLSACIIKGNRMDWIIEKAVELGAWRIRPVISDRTIVRLKPGQIQERTGRWQRIADGATRQCGAAWRTTVKPAIKMKALPRVDEEASIGLVAALTPGAEALKTVTNARAPETADLLVGPEGDFTSAELTHARARGYRPISLGGRVLRAETACLYALSVVNSAWQTPFQTHNHAQSQ